ncbi:MAG: hypothetical protein AAF665_18445 [Pseudomonadota bacterium]
MTNLKDHALAALAVIFLVAVFGVFASIGLAVLVTLAFLLLGYASVGAVAKALP